MHIQLAACICTVCSTVRIYPFECVSMCELDRLYLQYSYILYSMSVVSREGMS